MQEYLNTAQLKQPFKLPPSLVWTFFSGSIVLLAMTCLRLFLLFSFPAPSGNTDIPVARVLALGLRFDARIVSVPCLLLLLLSWATQWDPYATKKGKKAAMVVWTIFFIVTGVFYAIDFANFAYLKQRLNAGLLTYAADVGTSLHMVWQTYPVIKITIGIALSTWAFSLIVRALYKTIPSANGIPAKAAYKHTIRIIACLFLCFVIYGKAGQYPLRWSDAFVLGNDYASNLSLNPYQSFFSSLQFRHSTYDRQQVEESFPLMASYLDVPPSRLKSELYYGRHYPGHVDTSPRPPMNVVLVICESFSAYKSSAFGNALGTTPYFDSLSRSGIFFTRCFTPSYGTARGVWTTLTGTPDVDQSRTSSRNPNAVNQRLIINDFKGYEKFYFIGGSLSWANIRGMLTNNIPNLHIYEQDDYGMPKVDVWGVSDKNLFLGANRVLAQQQKPFFAIIQTADNHRPYTIPDEDKKEFDLIELPLDSLRKNGFDSNEELNAFRYTDYCYRAFFKAAEKEAYFENTLFVFVGDHGIGGDASNLFPAAWTAELSSQHVPLLFYAPYRLRPQAHDYPASQSDVFPTIAGLCGIPYTNTTMGRDLLGGFLDQHPEYRCAFIYNPDKRRIGIVKGDVYYSYGIDGKLGEQAYGLANDKKMDLDEKTKEDLYRLTNGWYQTARYLLLNNKH